MKRLSQSFIMFVLLIIMSGCSTNKVNSTFKNSQVSESDKYTQEESRFTVKGNTGSDVAAALSFIVMVFTSAQSKLITLLT